MAEQARFFDVWILETKTAYQRVPYSVVTDWLQQGRLLAEDRLRPSGTKDWLTLAEMPIFAPFMPKAEPHRAEDVAEALEPVQVGFAWGHRRGAEDEDVDMIPLIDISLVLLIFFMMTSAVSSAASSIKTPEARINLITINPEMIWVGIDRGPDGQPTYSLGKGDSGSGTSFASREELLAELDRRVKASPGRVDIRLRANRDLPHEVVRDMAAAVEPYKRGGKVGNIYGEVSAKETR